ncbi:MAG TPA: MarR family transcriptional regulator [Pseudonocardiaceae bacterium]|nr:MarR family transcriptional regulator [Pseudonocardiaceae bacterium]
MAETAVDSSQALGEALYGLVIAAIRGRAREISLTSASTLSTLSRTGPQRLTDLATAEGIAQPSMTTLVTGLERNGLVERRPDAGDRRVVLVALTEAGRDYLRRRRQTGADWFAALIDQLSEEDTTALAAALPALDHLRELDGPQRAMTSISEENR